MAAVASSSSRGHTAKVLTIGPACGRITELISKVTAIQSKHGPFACLLILGDLFTPNGPLTQPELDLLAGTTWLPIPTYFYLGSAPLPHEVQQKVDAASHRRTHDAPFQIANNLFYLGKSGVCLTPQGFRIAFCGGTWDATKWAESMRNATEGHGHDLDADNDNADDQTSPYITTHAVHRLLSHPSFALPKPVPAQTAASSSAAAPQTLAAAKAQAKAAAASAAVVSENAALLDSRPPLDFLLTNYWPSGIALFSNAALPDDSARIWGCAPLANIARAGAPRYHFALAPGPEDDTTIVGLGDEVRQVGAFWEREPYQNDLGLVPANANGRDQGWASRQRTDAAAATEPVTRFISLARFANAKKARWFMALKLAPASSPSPPPPKPANTTASPYFSGSMAGGAGGAKRTADAAGIGNGNGNVEGGDLPEAGPNFRFSQDARGKRRRVAGEERDDGPPPPGYKCRICGSEEHYIRLCPQKGQGKPARDGDGGNRDAASSTSGAGAGAGDGTGPRPPPSIRASTILPPGLAGLPSKPAFLQRERLLPVGPEDCWFCLSNPQCAKHLIVSIGDETYLALPKGALPSPTTTSVPGGGHVLIVPMSHFGSLFEAEDAAVADETMRETQRVKARLRRCFRRYGATMVCWEIGKSSRSGSRVGHTMVQAVAVPSEMEARLEEVFEERAAKSRMEFIKDPRAVDAFFQRVGDAAAAGGGGAAKEEAGIDYLALELGDDKKWLLKIAAGGRLAVQFVRQTLAALLDIPDRADWKSCVRSEDEEKSDVQAFRNALNASDEQQQDE
ncbi:uncharacterized protein PFL1_05941 [Pseudozyma flocculosa PF-1]|uniref:CCHC-type domain-containing protein n=1 Tax=Pseudozyma flocculosa PF-1 TaxID=1277687 RepID=A0A061H3Y0_9BASI|nr:uncharacterized protein PFL1_05941 [Pseudozyma flocculosa PF-1]EPQ26620.1 hypothetical protein PFL1_05941 [Pseudozyma flocculosa PF-1]